MWNEGACETKARRSKYVFEIRNSILSCENAPSTLQCRQWNLLLSEHRMYNFVCTIFFWSSFLYFHRRRALLCTAYVPCSGWCFIRTSDTQFNRLHMVHTKCWANVRRKWHACGFNDKRTLRHKTTALNRLLCVQQANATQIIRCITHTDLVEWTNLG